MYLLVDPNLVKEAGNLTRIGRSMAFPTVSGRGFDLKSPQEDDKVRMHPVRASVSLLPDGHRLLVGIDVTQQRRFASTFRYATLWGIGADRTRRRGRRIFPEPQAHAPGAKRGGYLRCHRRR